MAAASIMGMGKKGFCITLMSLAMLLPAAAEIPVEEALGIYENTIKERRNLSPLWGVVALESGVLAREHGDGCPQDAISGVIQYLFPSRMASPSSPTRGAGTPTAPEQTNHSSAPPGMQPTGRRFWISSWHTSLGIALNVTNKLGHTPLTLAVAKGFGLQKLLDAGAAPHLRLKAGGGAGVRI